MAKDLVGSGNPFKASSTVAMEMPDRIKAHRICLGLTSGITTAGGLAK